MASPTPTSRMCSSASTASTSQETEHGVGRESDWPSSSSWWNRLAVGLGWSPSRASRGSGLRCPPKLSGRNILVVAKNILRVVFRLHGPQPPVLLSPIRAPDLVGVGVVVEIVNVG